MKCSLENHNILAAWKAVLPSPVLGMNELPSSSPVGVAMYLLGRHFDELVSPTRRHTFQAHRKFFVRQDLVKTKNVIVHI